MMSGLNWHTTTVVNSLENKNGFAEKIKGEAVEGVLLFPSSLEGTNKKSFIRVAGTDDAPVMQVAHVMNFHKVWDNRYGKVKSIYKAPSIAGKLAEVEIDFNKECFTVENSPVKMFKLFVYISVDGANPFYYSNDFNVKGLPFGLEFTVLKGEEGEDVAKKVFKLITKNHIFQLDTDQLDVELDGSKIILRAKETFQRFALVKVSEFGPWDDYSIPVGELIADKMVNEEGEITKPTDRLKDDVIVCNEVGKNEFGTAAQLAQDLRLPTIENLKWGSSTNWQQPLPGRTYTQYIITVAAPSNNGGVMAVGERMVSETTHIFWVIEDEDVIADFDAALAKINDEFTETSPFEKVDTKSLADEGAAADESAAYTEEA